MFFLHRSVQLIVVCSGYPKPRKQSAKTPFAFKKSDVHNMECTITESKFSNVKILHFKTQPQVVEKNTILGPPAEYPNHNFANLVWYFGS